MLRGHSFGQFALGLYLISLGINYVPMLIYALAITGSGNAQAELGDELNDKRRAMAKYRRMSLWLLVPLLCPLPLGLSGERFQMAFQLLLDEVEHLHSVSTRLEGLAEEHTRVTVEILTIAGSVRSAATLLAVLVATRLHGRDGNLPHDE